MRESLQQSVIPSGLQNSGFVTQSETERLLKLLGETRDVELAALPEVPADTAPVTELGAVGEAYIALFQAEESGITQANVPSRLSTAKANANLPDERRFLGVEGDDGLAIEIGDVGDAAEVEDHQRLGEVGGEAHVEEVIVPLDDATFKQRLGLARTQRKSPGLPSLSISRTKPVDMRL